MQATGNSAEAAAPPDLAALADSATLSDRRRRELCADASLIRYATHQLHHGDSHCRLAASKLLCALGCFTAPRGASTIAARRPLRRRGVSILALDGGGTRALLTLQMLKELERRSGRQIHELFDVIGGTSTGGILALGIQQRYSLDELERLYLGLAAKVFRKDPLRHGQLLLTGGSYKAATLEAILRREFAHPAARFAPPEGRVQAGATAGDLAAAADRAEEWRGHAHSMLEARAAQEAAYHASAAPGRAAPPPPHAFVVCCLASRTPPAPYVLRNYELPPATAASPPHAGSSRVAPWLALRATTAAPTYFPTCVLPAESRAFAAAATTTTTGSGEGGSRETPREEKRAEADPNATEDGGGGGSVVLADGGLLANNPAAVALREAQALYPGAPIAVLASFGTGAFAPSRTRGRPDAIATTVGTRCMVRVPPWWRHGWPPVAHQAASEGLRLPSSLVRSGPAHSMPPRGRGHPARGRPSRHVRCV